MNESIRITWRGNGREFKLFNDKKRKKNTCVRIGWKNQMIQ